MLLNSIIFIYNIYFILHLSYDLQQFSVLHLQKCFTFTRPLHFPALPKRNLLLVKEKFLNIYFRKNQQMETKNLYY